MDGSKKDELEELIKKLSEIKGRHTELVTVYIPIGQNINTVSRQLEAEKSTAKNIKSASTRKNVTEALEKIIRTLKDYKKTPENGLALFCGNVSKSEGVQDLQLWVVEPPTPLKTRAYRCDKEFVLEPLREILEITEVYGLLVMDRKEATIGMLEGKRIELLQKMSSGVPSKVRAGGQRLSEDTLIIKDTGEIIELKYSHNPLMILSENFNLEEVEKTPVITKWENNKELFEITSKYPKLKIRSSKDHNFFVRTKNGIEEKPLSEINEGDYLIMPEKIGLDLNDQDINFSPEIKQKFNMKEINIPNRVNSDLARILGYYLGDGSYETDRISFFEQRKEVAEYYKNLIDNLFGVESDLRFRKSKNYWQIRVYSRILTQFFKSFYPQQDKTHNGNVPSIILRSSDKSLASFLGGFFDAEGYVSKSRVAAGFNNSLLARYIQLALLRLGIISSINEYDNRKNSYSNKTRYTIAIDDLESLKLFHNFIKFCSLDKQGLLHELIRKRSNRNKVRQIVVHGKYIAKIIRNSGLNTRQFNCPDFFNNKKQLSKELFKKNIVDKINDSDLKRRLSLFYNSNLIVVKIDKITSIGMQKTIDIETKNHNFIANGLIVHNSSQRFHRITEGLTKEFYKRIADEMGKIFLDMKKLKGIIVGGPIPTKDEFLDGKYLATKLREKVIGVKDIGDADESGLKELVEKSKDILAEQEIVYEKKILQNFFETLGSNPDKAVYKEEAIRKALEFGAVDLLIVSKKLNKDLSHDLKKLAENISAKIEVVSTETEEGQQFYSIGGMGALLRFKI